jgi:hypothetical protein
MMNSERSQIKRFLLIKAVLLVTLMMVTLSPASAFESAYLYNLATFAGNITASASAVAVDNEHLETYVADNGNRAVRIFNQSGMEVYRFGDDARLGIVRDLAVLPDGDILLLSLPSVTAAPVLLRCDYRGEPKQRIPLTGIPADWSSFSPSIMVLRDERLYLADKGNMLVVEADMQGEVTSHYDLARTIEVKASDTGLGGFTVDNQARLIFSVAAMFKVYILAPDGTLDAFGRPGSIPGRFGVVNGVATDAQGRIFVVDTLRCKVMAFGPDRDHEFLGELGGFGYYPGGLIAPTGVAVSADGKLYISQMSRRGVVVYRAG